MKQKRKIKYLIIITMVLTTIISLNNFASNIITVDEMMFDEPIVFNGVNGGTFEWNADGVITLDNFDGGSIRGNGDLEVVVKGDNKITCSQGETYGLSTQLGNLTIKGKGTLRVEATEKMTWSSAIYIVVDDEDKTINIDGVDIVANGAFAAIEANVEDYNRNGNTKSASLNIKNANVTLSGTNAAFICGDNANINLSNVKVDNPNNAYIVDLYMNNMKTAKVFSNTNEDMRILESEYDANNNLDDLKSFLAEYGMISDVVITNQPLNILLIGAAAVIIVILVLVFNLFLHKKKEDKAQFQAYN